MWFSYSSTLVNPHPAFAPLTRFLFSALEMQACHAALTETTRNCRVRRDCRLPPYAAYPACRSTSTGAWSLGALPLRSSRTIWASITRAANAGEPRMKSMRMPCFFGNRSCV